MPVDDPAVVHTFIKIMVTSYMDSLSNRSDFIFPTCGHYLYHDNLLPASEQHRIDFFSVFFKSICGRSVSTAKHDPLSSGLCVRVRECECVSSTLAL